MDDGVAKGSNIAVVLVIVAALIALAFGIFVVTKNQANEGSADLASSLNTVSTQVFQDFDQKVVTGNQVLSALKSFEGKPYAILISTKAFANDFPIAQSNDHPVAFIVEAGGQNYINYNAILSADGTDITTAPTNAAGWPATSVTAISGGQRGGAINPVITMTSENGVFLHTTGFQTVQGNIFYDNSIGGVNRSGNSEYIPATTKFQANLIKDASGAYVGIVLRQL
jgi:type II secretory pathway pseudopilin PulG